MSFGMSIVVGLVLAAAFTAPLALLKREWALDFLTVQLGGIAAVYSGFALMDGRLAPATAEVAVTLTFLVVALAGRWFSPAILAAGYFAHGGWDALHSFGAVTTAIPSWYVPFCIAYDFLVAAYVAMRFGRAGAA